MWLRKGDGRAVEDLLIWGAEWNNWKVVDGKCKVRLVKRSLLFRGFGCRKLWVQALEVCSAFIPDQDKDEEDANEVLAIIATSRLALGRFENLAV